MRNITRTVLTAALTIAALGVFSVFGADGVTKARLGSLRRDDLVVTDVSGGGGGGGVDTNAVKDIVAGYDRDIIQPREEGLGTNAIRGFAPQRLAPYLWELRSDREDFDAATNRLERAFPSVGGGCTGVCTPAFHGRNLDWTYDRFASVVVRSPGREGKYGVIGLSCGVLPDAFIESGAWTNAYWSLPFTLCDGINEFGVTIQQNVIPRDISKSASWHSRRAGHVISFAIIRYALDRCKTAREAADLIAAKTYIPDAYAYDFHFLVSDRTDSFIVEDGHVYTASEVPTDVLTNFRIGGTTYLTDRRVNWSSVEPYGNGLERYDLVRTNGFDKTTIDGMIGTMTNLWYTKTYKPDTVPFWYTEYCTAENPSLTVMAAKTNQSLFASTVSAWRSDYLAEHTPESTRYRGGKTWQTTHTAIYDKWRRTMTLFTQEDRRTKRVVNYVEDRPDSVYLLADTANRLNTTISNMNNLAVDVYKNQDRVIELETSNSVSTVRIDNQERTLSVMGEAVSNLTTRTPYKAPSDAYRVLDNFPPAVRISYGAGYGFHVLCTDGIYRDLRETTRAADGSSVRPVMRFPLSSLYGHTFTTNYLSGLFGTGVSWSGALVPSAANIDSPIVTICGGNGYPSCYDRPATVRDLLCDILCRDSDVWSDISAGAGHWDDYVALSGILGASKYATGYAAKAMTAVSQLRNDYLTGPVFGLPLSVVTASVSTASIRIDLTSADFPHVVIPATTGKIARIFFNIKEGQDGKRSAGCQALLECRESTYLMVFGTGTDKIVGASSLTLKPGYHLLSVLRVAYDSASNRNVYCVRISQLDYQTTRPDFTAGNETLVSTIDSRMAWTNDVIGDVATKVAIAHKPVRLGSYLWTIGTEGEDWTAATNRFAHVYPQYGGCSGVCSARYHGRNLDWNYDRGATVIIRSPAKEDRYGVIGVSSGAISDEQLESGIWTNAYSSLPFSLNDGMNEHGVVIQQNVIQRDLSRSVAWHTNRADSVIVFAIIRYALDRCKTARDAAGLIAARTYVPPSFAYDIHFLVSDANESLIVEDGQIYENSDVPTDIMTNFRIGTSLFNTNKTVRWDTVERYGIGLERYDGIRTNGLDLSTLDGVVGTLTNVWYTKAYKTATKPYWYTEHCDPLYTNLTVMAAKTNQVLFTRQVVEWADDYIHDHTKTDAKYRSGKTWQTVHTAVYDRERLTLRLFNQEDQSSERLFRLVADKELAPNDVGALPDDYSKLTNNVSFRQAVEAEIGGTAVTNGGAVASAKAYADATFRTKTDNVCHASEFGTWVAKGLPAGHTTVGQPDKTWIESSVRWCFAWEDSVDGTAAWIAYSASDDITSLTFESMYGYGNITGTRDKIATSGQPFVTADNVPSTNGLASLAGCAFTGEVQVASSDEGRQLRLRAHRIDVSVTNDAARVKVKNTDAETAASIVADESSAYLSLSGLDGGIDITNTGKISLSDGTEISIPRDKNGTLALYEDLLAVTNELIASSSGIIKADGSVFSFTTNATPWRLVSGWGGAKYENLLLTYKGNNTWSGQLEGGGITRFTLIYDPAGYWTLYDGDDEVYTFEGGPDVTHLSMPKEIHFELIRADSYKEEEGSFKPRGAVLTEQDRSSFRSRDDVVSHAFGYTDFSVTDPGTAGTIDWSTCWRSSRWGCWSVADTDGVWYNGYADYDATAVVFTNATRNVGFSASRFVSSWTNDVFVTYRGVTSAVERESRPLAAALGNKANAYVGIPRGEIVLYTQGMVPSDAVSYKMVRMQNSSTGVVFYKSPAPRYDGIRLNKSWYVGQYDLYTNDVFALALHEQPAGSGTYTGMLGSKTVVFSAPTDVRTDTNRVEKAEAIDDLFVADVARDGSNRLRVSYSNNDVRYIDNVASTLDYSRQNVAFSSAVRAAATDKQYALFIIHLNPNGGTHPFADIELKATTNNYVGESMMFYCASNVNGDETKWNADWCRLYILSSHVSLDVRQWIRIKNTDDLDDYNPRDLAVIVDPALFKRGQGTDWCTESNDELIWSYVRIHPTEGAEVDEGTGKQLWRPIMPVRWYKELPNWAKQPEYKP